MTTDTQTETYSFDESKDNLCPVCTKPVENFAGPGKPIHTRCSIDRMRKTKGA